MNVVIAGSLSFALLDKLCASFANAGTLMWYAIYIIGYQLDLRPTLV